MTFAKYRLSLQDLPLTSDTLQHRANHISKKPFPARCVEAVYVLPVPLPGNGIARLELAVSRDDCRQRETAAVTLDMRLFP